jgi:2-amino-4-hydroxy-6-hydroxymethyldihydropteridine diphosphokinase
LKESVFLLLGSNRGDREKYLERALTRIGETTGQIIRISSVYETEPWGFSDPELFLNRAVEILTGLDPAELLGAVTRIEKEAGRTRDGGGYGPRTLDIDILLFGDRIVDQPGLAIPHPRMPERRFALVPLAEIAGNRVHPVLGCTIKDLLSSCPDTRVVEKKDFPVR